MEKEKSLKELTVRDVLTMPLFEKKMQEVIDGEVFSHRKAQTEAMTKGLLLQRVPLDRLRERDLLHGDKMVDLYGAVLDKSLIGFSASEREYIYQIGKEAFMRTMYKLKEMEEKEKEKKE